MKIFLTAASGNVGSRVLPDLLAAGHEVVAHAHSERSFERLKKQYPNLPIVRGDVTKLEDMLRAIPSGTEAVIYLPGVLRDFPQKGITFRGTHVEGVQNTLAAAKQAGAMRWIQMSALGAKPNGATEYYRTKWDAEELVRASGLEWTILRPSVIFDDRSSELITFTEEIAKAIRQLPFVPILGSGKFRLQPVSNDDVSQTIVQSLSNTTTIDKTYEIGGPDKLTYEEIANIIAKSIGSKKPIMHIPVAFAKLAARLLQRFAIFPFSVDQIVMLEEENIVLDEAKDREWRETFVLPMKRFSVETIKRALW